LGILILATGALTIIFGTQETSDFWVDGLQVWWLQVKDSWRSIRRLVIYLDNGPNNSGTRTQFLKRMIEFADWSGLEIRLVYYPPYHSKYNPIERCWSILEQKWGGSLLNCLKVILQQALRMKWCGQHRSAPNSEATAWRIPGWRSPYQERNEAVRNPLGTLENITQVRHRNPTKATEMRVNQDPPLA